MASAEDELRVALVVNANIKGMQTAMRQMQALMKGTAENIDESLSKIGQRGGDPTRKLQDGISKMQGSMRAATGNMTAQLNDITSTLLSGSSPFTVMVQQGSQVTQILQEMASQAKRTGQAFSIFSLLGGAFKNLISPMSLVVNGMILLGGMALPKLIDLGKSWLGISGETEKKLKEEASALENLTKKYGDLLPAMQRVQKARDDAAAKQDIAGALATSTAEVWKPTQEAINGVVTQVEDLRDALRDFAGDDRSVAQMGMSFDELLEKVKNNTATVAELQTLVSNIRAANLKLGGDPELEKLAQTIEAMIPALTLAGRETQNLEADARAAENSLLGMHEAATLFAQAMGLSGPVVDQLLEGLEKLSPEVSKIGTQIKDQLGAAFEEAAKKQKAYDEAMKKMEETAQGPLNDVEKVLEQHKIALENATGSAQRYNAELAKTNALNQLNVQQSEQLGELAVSGLSNYADKVAMLESGGRADAKNKDSSASGLFQFLDKTFLTVARSMDEFSALTDQQIMAQKNNVEVQKKVFEKFTAQNAAVLDKHGVNINDATLYMAHVLGAGTAARVAKADPSRPIADIVGPKAARINPTLLGNRTVAETMAAFARKTGTASAEVNLKTQKDMVDSTREEAQIRGEISTQMDENVRKEEEAVKLAELMRDLRKKAAEEGRSVTQEEEAQAKRIAAAWGQTQGAIEGHKKALADAKTLTDAIASYQTRTDKINAELEVVNALGGAYDKLTYEQEKAATVAALLAKARADGVEATASEKEQIERIADAYAKAQATQEQYQNGQKDFHKSQKDNIQTATQLADTYAGMATQFFSGFISDLRNGKSATEALSNALGRLGDQLLDMALNSLFQNLFKNMFGVGGGAGQGLSFFPAAPTMHGGGTVGLSRHFDGRRFPAGMWAGAPRFQSGGVVGLRPGEVPIIAHRGELVVPAGQVNRGGSVTGDDNRQYNVAIKVDSNGRANLTEGNGTVLGKKLNMAVQEVIAKEQRSGGLLAGTGPGRR